MFLHHATPADGCRSKVPETIRTEHVFFRVGFLIFVP
jgi:hypothetical protein